MRCNKCIDCNVINLKALWFEGNVMNEMKWMQSNPCNVMISMNECNVINVV